MGKTITYKTKGGNLAKKKLWLSEAQVRNLARAAGIDKMGDDAFIKFNETIEDHAVELFKKSLQTTREAKKKVVKAKHIPSNADKLC